MTHHRSPTTIAVLGAGAWGTALAIAIARQGNTVHLWSNDTEDINNMRQTRCNQRYLGQEVKLPESITLHTELEQAVAEVNDLLLVVPSAAFASVAQQLRQIDNSQRFCIAWGTKGLDPQQHQLLQDTITQSFPSTQAMAVISGPSFAQEVAEGQLTRLTIASNNPDFRSRLQHALASELLSIELSDDMPGVQLCGCAKNVFAILLGICHGLQWGDNARAALLSLSFQEMHRLLHHCAADPATLLTAAGVGDMILTCCNQQSRNYQFGMAVANCDSIEAAQTKVGKLVEGYSNSKQLYQYFLQSSSRNFPVLHTAYSILHQQTSPAEALRKLLIQH